MNRPWASMTKFKRTSRPPGASSAARASSRASQSRRAWLAKAACSAAVASVWCRPPSLMGGGSLVLR